MLLIWFPYFCGSHCCSSESTNFAVTLSMFFFFFNMIEVLIHKVITRTSILSMVYVDRSALTTLYLNIVSQNSFAIVYWVRAFHLVLHCVTVLIIVVFFSLNNTQEWQIICWSTYIYSTFLSLIHECAPFHILCRKIFFKFYPFKRHL